jgi:hypothetical protein
MSVKSFLVNESYNFIYFIFKEVVLVELSINSTRQPYYSYLKPKIYLQLSTLLLKETFKELSKLVTVDKRVISVSLIDYYFINF